MSTADACPFCALPMERVIWSSDLCWVIRDADPVSLGHSLIIPRRHFSSFFETTGEEGSAILEALVAAKHGLDMEFQPIAYNIGINDGPGAGQTVLHSHVHLIPRYEGDTDDSRGGIRRIFPDKASSG